jgi:hypothetical protein
MIGFLPISRNNRWGHTRLCTTVLKIFPEINPSALGEYFCVTAVFIWNLGQIAQFFPLVISSSKHLFAVTKALLSLLELAPS